MGLFNMMSEDYILDQLSSQISSLAANIKAVLDLQKDKLQSTKEIIEKLRDSPRQAGKQKRKVFGIIDDQEKHAKSASKTMEKIRHYLNLLVHMEQASLVIHNKKSQDDLSRMIDVFRLPIEKFEQEQEQVRLLENSIQILNVELSKQREYLKAFDLKPETHEEDYFLQSGEYESKLSESDIVKVSELKSFVSDLHKMISSRKDQKIDRLTESDKAAMAIKEEMVNIKMEHRIFFPVTTYGFLHSLVRSTIKNKDMDKLALFIITFLFSRLKKFRKESYYSQLRAGILAYNLLKHESVEEERLNTIVGAALLANLNDLDFTQEDIDSQKDDPDEPKIIKQYYKTAEAILSDEFPFMNNVLKLHRRTELEDPLVPWVVDGSRCLGLIYDFDKELSKSAFDPGKVKAGSEAAKKKLKKKFARMKNIDRSVDYLFDDWQKRLPRSICEAKYI
jgi:hypothetical protein